MYEIAIVGGGPAGLAAAVNARRRNKQVVVIAKEEHSFKLVQSHQIDNYLGLPEITGVELAQKLRSHAETMGVEFAKDEVQSISQEGRVFSLWGRENMWEAYAVILAVGVSLGAEINGEAEFTGRGVSYCATCDGMFFRDKTVAVIGYIPEAEAEARFLAEICAKVYYLPQYKKGDVRGETSGRDLGANIEVLEGKPTTISGAERVATLQTSQGEWSVDGVFIERSGKPFHQLLDGLQIIDNLIYAGADQATNLPGVFAAGDCTGKPWQISRAVGQGQVAALSAVHYLETVAEIPSAKN